MPTEELSRIIDQYPVCIPVATVAAFLDMAPASLRASMDQNRCPFGFSWKLGERSGYKIPTITFVAWLSKGTYSPTT